MLVTFPEGFYRWFPGFNFFEYPAMVKPKNFQLLSELLTNDFCVSGNTRDHVK